MVLILAACHTMQVVPPSALGAERAPAALWVTTTADREPILVQDPVLSGDTLTALLHGEPVQFLLSQTTSLRAREIAPFRTALLVGAVGGAALGMLVYLQNRPDVKPSIDPGCVYNIAGTFVNPCCQGTPDSLPC